MRSWLGSPLGFDMNCFSLDFSLEYLFGCGVIRHLHINFTSSKCIPTKSQTRVCTGTGLSWQCARLWYYGLPINLGDRSFWNSFSIFLKFCWGCVGFGGSRRGFPICRNYLLISNTLKLQFLDSYREVLKQQVQPYPNQPKYPYLVSLMPLSKPASSSPAGDLGEMSGQSHDGTALWPQRSVRRSLPIVEEGSAQEETVREIGQK